MARYVFVMVVSGMVVLFTPLMIWYRIWDNNRPKVGPVGNGPVELTWLDFLPWIIAFVCHLGILILVSIKFRQARWEGDWSPDK
ncbi:hypothetical protein PA598K_05731 [Paenibacillus sp. 598K]|uniref:hypothetical protein n=1 Tax=Paenibacillus sp. 598K TaxID=1117987 RepID=UPI000FFA63C4|nr:hypothetical protein [Paenibacillus sp. 598K]GBF77196.1 hypothetical protein PA598K_05731 [Paenibacillus sp. 598K]